MQRASHITIMSGEVVVFAPDFYKDPHCVIGHGYDPMGFYEISASSSAVMVHQCIISESEELHEFTKAMEHAFDAMQALKKHRGSSKLYSSEPVTIP
jgi:hypothetical protein